MLILIIFGFLAGIATILSPCILPILPIMLSGAIGGKSRSYGILLGFAISFSVFTIFIATFIDKLGFDLDVLRLLATGILILLGLILIFPQIGDLFKKIIPAFNPRSGKEPKPGFWGGFLTGTSLGLIWTPCAGPILAAVLTIALTQQASIGLFLIVLAYSLGTSFMMLLIILGSRNILEKIRSLNSHLESIQKIFGVLIILAGIAIGTGYDRIIQTAILQWTPQSWNSFLQKFENFELVKNQLEKLQEDMKKNTNSIVVDEKDQPKNNAYSENSDPENSANKYDDLFNLRQPVPAPELEGISHWLNSQPLSLAELRGKVVLIDFWTYSCINCIRTLPYLKSWHQKYADQGLVIIGIHSPEFPFEKKLENVQQAVNDFKIKYPVALDNDFKTWRAYSNRYWPAKYFIDHQGNVRHVHFGEGEYEKSEQVIQALLNLAGSGENQNNGINQNNGGNPSQNNHGNTSDKTDKTGTSETPGTEKVTGEVPISPAQTPETYLGYWRLENFDNENEYKENQTVHFTATKKLIEPHHWRLEGTWQMDRQELISKAAQPEAFEKNSVLKINFSAKSVFLVMGAAQPTRITVELEGKALSESEAGADVIFSKSAGSYKQEVNYEQRADEDNPAYSNEQKQDSSTQVEVGEFRLYRLIEAEQFIKNGLLKITAPENVKMYAFTFGS